MELNTNYSELLDETQHKMGYYGFKPEKKYGKQGFCNSCHRNFVLRMAFYDKFTYPDKTVWIGSCPLCGASIRMVDKVAPPKTMIMGTHPGHEGNATTAVTPIIKATVVEFRQTLSAIIGLRKYYKNQIRCTFLANGDNMIDDGLEDGQFYEYEREYYENVVITMIKTIKENPVLDEFWWKSVDETKATLEKDISKRSLFVNGVHKLIDAIKEYEEKNWDKFFGAEACMHVKEDGFQPHVEKYKEIGEWTKANQDIITTFKTTRMTTEYETDDVLAENEIEKEIESIDKAVQVMDEIEEKEKGLDELEYGVDEILDI